MKTIEDLQALMELFPCKGAEGFLMKSHFAILKAEEAGLLSLSEKETLKKEAIEESRRLRGEA